MQRFDAGTEHTKMKWNLALRIETSPSERWFKKAAEWNPDLSSRYRTNGAIRRPRKSWEDDINDFFKQILEEKKVKNQSKEGLKTTTIGSTWPKIGENGLNLKDIHIELCKMTENKKRRDDDLEQSSSSANALRNASSYWKHFKQQQQRHSGQEHCDGGQTRIKKYVTDSHARILFVPKKKSWDLCQVRLLLCGILPSLSPGVVASPGFPGRSSPPGFLLFCYFCGVAPNPRIL